MTSSELFVSFKYHILYWFLNSTDFTEKLYDSILPIPTDITYGKSDIVPTKICPYSSVDLDIKAIARLDNGAKLEFSSQYRFD